MRHNKNGHERENIAVNSHIREIEEAHIINLILYFSLLEKHKDQEPHIFKRYPEKEIPPVVLRLSQEVSVSLGTF